ncbi:DTX3L ligase, partial [Crypturellus undulatus]|nr:DTX3L ligase [Crypturellus undulatus]
MAVAPVMAVAPLLVRVVPAPDADGGEKLRLKLQKYFQSKKQSGGGECEVQAGAEPGTYRVHFSQERGRRRAARWGAGAEARGAKWPPAALGLNEPRGFRRQEERGEPRKARPGREQAEPGDPHRAGAGERVPRRAAIFIEVSATLNARMFTKQDREKITMLCPNLRRERSPDFDGFEKLTGDYTDIEKVYHYCKDLLAGDDESHNFSHSESKSDLEVENGVDAEKMLCVPSAHYEYFSHAHEEEMKELCERFGVGIRINNNDSGNTQIRFTCGMNPTSIQSAKEAFTTTFQKSIQDLDQKKISFANSKQLEEAKMKISHRFPYLLVKQEGNKLILRGPASGILSAKEFLREESENSQTEKNMHISSQLYKYRNGIEVDASEFKPLEPILSREIEDISQNFDTMVDNISHGQKMIIRFSPRSNAFDMSAHATESFINAFQNASAKQREKDISWKFSEDDKKRLNMLADGKELEDLHIKFKEEKMVSGSLPNYLHAAEKHNMNLDTEKAAQAKNRTALVSDPSPREASRLSEMKYDRQKSKLSSKEQVKSKAEDEEQGKDVCPICMDSIDNKEVLTKCKHAFCKSCIRQAMTYKKACPVCNTCYGLVQGDQPEGTMTFKTIYAELPGYPTCKTIEITYTMHSGIQTNSHPNPGKYYFGTTRKAYLPDNKEGREILHLLRKAFDQKLIFTVGQSRTTGAPNVITWNDIHHKTQIYGGP